MGIEGRSTCARRAPPSSPAGPGGPIEGKAGGGLPRQLTAGVVLGDELNVAVLDPTVGVFDLEAEVRQLEMPVTIGSPDAVENTSRSSARSGSSGRSGRLRNRW